MTFWKKLLGFSKQDKQPNAHTVPPISDNPQQTAEDLQKLLTPLLREATKLKLSESSKPPAQSQLVSHFGGQPYFEQGEKWPASKKGRPMSFIFQVFNQEGLVLPKEIKLVQFYYDWDEFPWDTDQAGWLVKIYEELNPEQIQQIDKPEELDPSPYCEIAFENVGSLPDWEGIDVYSADAAALATALNEEEPWEAYDQAVEKLIGNQRYQSRLGGYPTWIQGESTPKKKNGENMKLLFQIDSEDNAGLMWGDVGIIYVFYDENTKRLEFTLQCH